MIKVLLIVAAIFGSLLISAPVMAQDGTLLNRACKQAPKSAICQQAAKQNNKSDNPVVRIIHIATNIIALIAGIVGVIMIIISGLILVTSQGNAERIADARRRIVYSLVGLVVIGLSWTIIRFITDQVLQ